MMAKLALALFFAAHGLIHLGYVAPAPADANYPFRLNRSWLMTGLGMNESLIHALGIALSLVTIAGFALTGLALMGIVVPVEWGPRLAVISAAASLLLLLIFWHPWLVLGVAIDVALLVGLVVLNWEPFATTGP